MLVMFRNLVTAGNSSLMINRKEVLTIHTPGMHKSPHQVNRATKLCIFVDP